MTTFEQISATRRRLETELAAVDKELADLYEAMNEAAGDIRSDPTTANKSAAAIVALEARRKVIAAKQIHNQQQADRLAAQTKTKEYKAGVKAIADAETFAASEVQEIKDLMSALHKRLTAATERATEYRRLVDRFGMELTEAQRMRKRSNKDFAYLAALFVQFEQRAYAENRIKAAREMSAQATDPKRAAEMDRRRAAMDKERAKRKPEVMPEQRPMPLDPSALVAPRERYTEPKYPDA